MVVNFSSTLFFSFIQWFAIQCAMLFSKIITFRDTSNLVIESWNSCIFNHQQNDWTFDALPRFCNEIIFRFQAVDEWNRPPFANSIQCERFASTIVCCNDAWLSFVLFYIFMLQISLIVAFFEHWVIQNCIDGGLLILMLCLLICYQFRVVPSRSVQRFKWRNLMKDKLRFLYFF